MWVIGVFPDKDGFGRFEDVDAIVKELDEAWRGERADGALGAEFEGEFVEAFPGGCVNGRVLVLDGCLCLLGCLKGKMKWRYDGGTYSAMLDDVLFSQSVE